MNSSFEKYIKAAMDSHQYSVVCEMANVIYPEKNKINMMTYPGKDVRIYKNREDEIQILCPNDISITQESNITKAISTGTIFEDADEVDKYAGFIVKTKMPIDAMTNKGLENPYKIKEMVGSTIGVMDEDGDVDVSDTDVDNGNNVIDDLLKKDSKEFKDVKNVVDDYLGNDSHEFGYDKDFTADIQQLRDEINNFKDADISPEDSITDDDWNDDWGSATSIMGDHNDAEDERDSDDEPSEAEDNLDVADDDDEDENNEDDELTQEAYNLIVDPSFVQEGAITLLKEIGYNPMTRTFVTDVPVRYGKPGEKEKCRLKIGGPIARANGPCFTEPPATPEPTIHIPLKSLIGDKQKLLGLLKHEEGHFYVSLNRKDLDDQFDHAEKIVSKYGSKMTDHENSREEYVADLYSARHTSDAGEGLIAGLKDLGFKNRKSCTLVTKGLIKIDKFLTSAFKLIRNKSTEDNPKITELAKNASDELIDIESTIKKISELCQITIGYGAYSKSRDQFDIWHRYGRNKEEYDNAILEFEKKFTTDSVELKQSVGDLEKLKSRAMKSTLEEIDILEARLHKLIKRFIKHLNEYRAAYDFGIKVRIANIRKYGDKAQTESFEYDLEANDCSIYLEMLADEPMEYQFTQEEYEILQYTQYVQEGVFKSLKKIGYDPKTKTFVTDIPVKNGKPGEKMKCKVAINSIISIMNGPCFTVPPATPEPTLHIPLKYMIGNTDKLMGIIKHEEGHFYVSLNRDDMKDEFDKAGELVVTYGPEMSDHGNFPEEYIADTYSAKHTDDNAEGLIKVLEAAGKKNHKNVAMIIALFKASAGIVKVIFKILRTGEKTKLFGKTIQEHIKQLSNNYKSSDDIVKRLIRGYTAIGLTLSKGPGIYSKTLLENDKSRVKSDIHKKYFEKMQKYIDDFGKNVDKLEDIEDEITGEVELDMFEQRCLKGIEKTIKLFQEFDEATLKEYEVRIKNIRDKNNGMIKEYATESAKPVPEYKTRKPLSLTHFLEIDDTANHDSSDVDYKADEESNTAELSKKPSNGGNVNTTMEEDTTTPAPMFSSGPEMQTEQTDDEELGYKLPEPIKDDKSFTKKITESTKVKEVVPDDLNAAPDDNHNPLLSPIHEGFMLKRPKKLKAIDVRGIASYVTVEMNAIKDSNDQAMLAGYVCSKLELIDFYLTVIDTNDDRYIVPHSRQYLVDGQRQLSDLLTKILRIRPINKSSRIWQIEKI